MQESELIHDWNTLEGSFDYCHPPRRAAQRRDAARRAPVALGDRPADRGQDPPAAPDGRAGDRRGRHRAAGRGAARGARRGGARARDRRAEARHRAQLRRAHRPRRRAADRGRVAAGGDRHRGGDLHRLVAHPPVRGGLDAGPDAPRHRGRGLVRGLRGAAGDVRDRGHHARPAGGAEGALRHRHLAAARGASAWPTRWGTRRRTGCGSWCASSATRSWLPAGRR
jgi:hypothetical protein